MKVDIPMVKILNESIKARCNNVPTMLDKICVETICPGALSVGSSVITLSISSLEKGSSRIERSIFLSSIASKSRRLCVGTEELDLFLKACNRILAFALCSLKMLPSSSYKQLMWLALYLRLAFAWKYFEFASPNLTH